MFAILLSMLLAQAPAAPEPDDDPPGHEATLIIAWQAKGSSDEFISTYPEPGMVDCAWDAQELLTVPGTGRLYATCSAGWDYRT